MKGVNAVSHAERVQMARDLKKNGVLVRQAG